MAVRGLSWAASAGKTAPTQYFCPNIGASFRRKVGFGWAPPPWGSGLALFAKIPAPGESLWHEKPAAKWVRNREMN